MNHLVYARFVPQAWVDDYAVDVDCEGPDTFDVTPEIRAMGREAASRLQPNTYESDDLRFAASAPDWVKNWSGPFYVELLDDVSAAFDGEGAYDDGHADGCEAGVPSAE